MQLLTTVISGLELPQTSITMLMGLWNGHACRSPIVSKCFPLRGFSAASSISGLKNRIRGLERERDSFCKRRAAESHIKLDNGSDEAYTIVVSAEVRRVTLRRGLERRL
jgi:hypothetical protein